MGEYYGIRNGEVITAKLYTDWTVYLEDCRDADESTALFEAGDILRAKIFAHKVLTYYAHAKENFHEKTYRI